MRKLLGALIVVVGIVVAWPYVMANSSSPWPDGWDPDQDVGLYIADTSGQHCVEFLVGAKHSGFRRSWVDVELGQFSISVYSAAGRGTAHYHVGGRTLPVPVQVDGEPGAPAGNLTTHYVRTSDRTWWDPDVVGFDEAEKLEFQLDSSFHGMMSCGAVGPVRISGAPTDVQIVCDLDHHGLALAWREGDGLLELQLYSEPGKLGSLGGEVCLAGSYAHFPFVKEGDRLVARVPLAQHKTARVLRTHVAVNYNQGFGGKRVVVTLE